MRTWWMVLLAWSALGARTAAAQTISMSWAPCNQPLASYTTVSPGEASGPGGPNLDVFISNMALPTHSYELRMLYGDENKLTPDAWRFDAGGCQGPSFLALSPTSQPAVAKACPGFKDAGGSRPFLTQSTVGPLHDWFNLPATLSEIDYAVAYPPGNAPSPDSTYLLLELRFDETYGVAGVASPGGLTCGGLDRPMCFAVMSVVYQDLSFNDVPIDVGWDVVMQHFCYSPPTVTATANWGGPGSCTGTTPVHAATWGSVKAQYRR